MLFLTAHEQQHSTKAMHNIQQMSIIISVKLCMQTEKQRQMIKMNSIFLKFHYTTKYLLVNLTRNKPSMAQNSRKKACIAALPAYFCIATCGFA